MKQMLGIMFLLVVTTGPVSAAAGDQILGVWNNEEQDAAIEIFKCGEKFCGRVVWIKEPNYPSGSKDGIPGTPKLDHNKPDPESRKTPILGLQIVHDFAFAGNAVWKGGTVYDPKNGKQYNGTMTLVSPYQLNLRGFVGITLLGRTVVWTR